MLEPIPTFVVSRDPDIYEAWPDVALTGSGKLVCVFSECTHHGDRSYTRVVTVTSADRGRTWSAKRPLTEGTRGCDYYYNCARITQLVDGRLVIIVDRLPAIGEARSTPLATNHLYYSSDDGQTWSKPVETPLKGIVPDRLLELDDGRWIIAAQHKVGDYLAQFLRYSDDQGATWSEPVTVAKQTGLNLCEVTIVPAGGDALVALMRENSGQGWDCMKTISHDRGETWGQVINFPLPGCHRPVAGWLQDGRALITYRFMQGGKGWLGSWTQNFFSAVTDRDSLLATERSQSWARVCPIDYDRSPKSDLGYSGWVQFPDGEIYIVNYIVDDAIDTAQIRGYSIRPDRFMLT